MGYPRRPLRERFMDKFAVNETTGCWERTACLSTKGYGKMGLHGRAVAAHRVAYELFKGPIPEGLTIDHLCRVPRCVNPEHLEAVTFKENVRRGLLCALHPTRTHCSRGHELTEQNSYQRTDAVGVRCRICLRDKHRRRYLREKAAA